MDGVLGGFGQVNDADIKGSEAFLNTLLHERLGDGGKNQQLVALGTLLFLSLLAFMNFYSFIMCH